jgi:hypothetical protein
METYYIKYMSITSQHLDDLSEEFGEYIGLGKEVNYDENYNTYYIRFENEYGEYTYEDVPEKFLPVVSRYMK